MSDETIAGRAPWLAEPGLQALLAVLAQGGKEARVAGGAVRNALMGQGVTDVDIATTTLPDETIARAKAAGFKAIPTGYEHGTITVVVSGKPYEVTTLRDDVETFGRHARVVFGTDWKRDAERRDFTINALYAEADGRVVDLVGGLDDIAARRLRFIGEAEQRIREDYLRILRFFRFFAWYGDGRPDAEGLKAATRLKAGLAGLSAERVWSELKKLLSAPDPSRSLLWMRQTGVLTAVLPESEKWGIDSIHPLAETEKALDWPVDPMLRLVAMVPPDAARLEAMASRLRMSKVEAAVLDAWAQSATPDLQMKQGQFEKLLYKSNVQGLETRLRLALAGARARAAEDGEALMAAAGCRRLLDILKAWEKPAFPVSGGDLIARGIKPGKEMGEMLSTLEDRWIESGFRLTGEELLAEADRAADG